uniref:UBC core domain-containing protein n=1 Tax=Vombatus ursinus TaxID=29139 RepID=A0A4X2LYD9_VOMUR
MSTRTQQWLMRDFKRLQKTTLPPGSMEPHGRITLRCSTGSFPAKGTLFEDVTFKPTMEFTEEYPNKPSSVRFVSKTFHPNVYADASFGNRTELA